MNGELSKWCWNKANHLQTTTSKQVKLRFIPKSIYKYKLQLDKSLKHENQNYKIVGKYMIGYMWSQSRELPKKTQKQRPQRKLIKYLTPKLVF